MEYQDINFIPGVLLFTGTRLLIAQNFGLVLSVPWPLETSSSLIHFLEGFHSR